MKPVVVKSWDAMPPVTFDSPHSRSIAYSTRVLEKQYRDMEQRIAGLEAHIKILLADMYCDICDTDLNNCKC